MKHAVFLIICIVALLGLLSTQEKVRQFLSIAAPTPANITIDVQNSKQPLFLPWLNFAQGGEEPTQMLSPAISAMQQLRPQYVRIDHIYDYYVQMAKGNDGYSYDFTQLDKTVDDILTMGALPFFSLSYMPKIFTENESVIDQPSNWQDWSNLVQKTIEHYSGKKFKNLTHVYYELWNEPELPQFGSWKLSSPKDYRMLYYYTSIGAQNAQNVNEFSLGGPSVGSYYPSWVSDFVAFVEQNNLRLDFYSWHRYGTNPEIFVNDAKNIRSKLARFPTYKDIPLILSEWGLDSDNTDRNNSDAAGAFTIAAARNFINRIEKAFAFEIKDGPPPNGGKWGLLTHERTTTPLSRKPRYKAFQTLTKLSGELLPLSGEGTFVSAIGTVENNAYKVIISNYDLAGKNAENVPVTFSRLAPGQYTLTYTYPLSEITGQYDDTTTTGVLSHLFPLQPNSLLFLQLTPVSQFADRSQGASGTSDDFSLPLTHLETSLIFTTPTFYLTSQGSVEFDLQVLWDDNNGAFYIFEIPYTDSGGSIRKLSLVKQTTGKNHFLTLLTEEGTSQKITHRIDSWEKNSWHHITVKWDSKDISLEVDGKNALEFPLRLTINEGKTLTFPASPIAIDNLIIRMNGKILIERHFNRDIDS
ncbi:hypothetical protein HYW55_04860 [Candidatus Gottesmanbacteria bacterium]|nr:hypothetical protein [Candidatus Gottesmanbacteria bacterium]